VFSSWVIVAFLCPTGLCHKKSSLLVVHCLFLHSRVESISGKSVHKQLINHW